MKLNQNEHVVVAWEERCAGPGWSNTPVWALIRDSGDGKLRIECIQPDEQSAEVRDHFAYSALSATKMTWAVEEMTKRKRKGRVREVKP